MMNKFALGSVLALVLALTSSALAGEECMKKIEAGIKQCVADMKLPPADLAFDKDFAQYSNGTKCLLKCVGEFIGVYKDDKLVDSTLTTMTNDFLKEHPEEKEMTGIILKDCKNISEACPCATAAKMFTCARDIASRFTKGKMQKKN
ncbi:uncharacterized protein LOC135942757 [Cloeon dipterum]|uniref:uncharacterized protein LOC135942757 n=1 Tax=Cloeon dipterum TaxID=197152 RepID=UPI0032204272